MKLVIAGSRSFDHHTGYGLVVATLVHHRLWPIYDHVREVVSGHCPDGIDQVGEFLARQYVLPCRLFPADWDRHGRPAGMIRNREMALYADAALVVWDGRSPGSACMAREMVRLGKPVYKTAANVIYSAVNLEQQASLLEDA